MEYVSMTVLRNKFASVTTGGPRQFTELQNKVLLRTTSNDKAEDIIAELDSLDLDGEVLSNFPVVTAEPNNRIEAVLERVAARRTGRVDSIQEGVEEIEESRREAEGVIDATTGVVAATRSLINELSGIPRVNFAEFVRTFADYGPENLRMSPSDMPTVPADEAREKSDTLKDLNESLNMSEVWETTRGENSIIAIFDTGFAEDLIDESRIRNTFHGDAVDTAFAEAEGHGSMTAGAALANKEEGVPFNGAAPEADAILVRITDDKGQIRGDIIANAWDWIVNLDLDDTLYTNHSYGSPLCSGRPRQKFCETTINDVVSIATSTPDIEAVYAGGNEGMQCGHRLSGVTNGITGTNSISDVFTVGALLSSGREAQRYTSHGRGDCSPVADPKPNFSCAIPKYTYYGTEDGWEIKDMSTGLFGSGGGTSHAAPYSTGILALIGSKVSQTQVDSIGSMQRASQDTDSLQTEELKVLVEETAELPRKTQVNALGLFLSNEGYDARFGHGQIQPEKALEKV